jgi:hypothetical protein
MTAGGNPSRKIGREGFTLLEILVAMVLTVFGILGFTGLLKVIGNVEAEDTWETKALFCAQERVEELKFACLTGEGLPTEGEDLLTEGPYQGMRREWTTEDSAVSEGLLEINVRCAYPWKGSVKEVGFRTLMFREE